MGHAFITYADPKGAKKAIERYNNRHLFSKNTKLVVEWMRGNPFEDTWAWCLICGERGHIVRECKQPFEEGMELKKLPND